ncbi:MAG: ATP-binding protein [Alphaproteobacteria bacterium]|nr:ATP-binding protein [Alphaproteobacteria bacterium]
MQDAAALLQPRNPFSPGPGLRPIFLAGRVDEQRAFARVLDKLLNKALEERSWTGNILITGEAGIGKTALLAEFRRLVLEHQFLWIGSAWTEAAAVAEKDVAERLMVDLAVALAPIVCSGGDEVRAGVSVLDDLHRIYNAEPGFASDRLKAVLGQVAEIISRAGRRGIVVAFDDAQNLADSTERQQFPLSLVCDVLANLQRRDPGCRFLLIMAGRPALPALLRDARNSTESMFQSLTLHRLTESETRDAIQETMARSGSTLTFPETVVACITEESKGHPFLIQYICRETFDAWLGTIGAGAVPFVPMREIAAKLDLDFFAPQWNRATGRQQIFLQVIATLEHAEGGFSLQDITSASHNLLRRPFTPSHAIQMLGHLTGKGLIHRNGRGAYCFAVPQLTGFIRRQAWNAAARRDEAAGAPLP